MPGIQPSFLESLKIQNINEYTCFVETGTLEGHTIFAMEPVFDELYTIEIKEEYFNNVSAKYQGTKINFLLGDSSYLLMDLCSKLRKNTIFFLDGHWSSGDTGKGSKDCPLYEEIENIINYHIPEAIIIIDDVRLFGKGPRVGNEICDWENINIQSILNIVQTRLLKHYFLPSDLHTQDRMVLHLMDIK
jgi:hypothetical protein